jgi:hypothetical protein
MRKVFVYTLVSFFYFAFINCSHDQRTANNIKLKIFYGQSYSYDLTSRIYSVNFRDKPTITVRFNLTNSDIEKINNEYYNLGIDQIRKEGKIIFDSECKALPYIPVILNIQTQERTQIFEIDLDCNRYIKSDAIKVKKFLLIVLKILRAKPEIKNSPESDIIYM